MRIWNNGKFPTFALMAFLIMGCEPIAKATYNPQAEKPNEAMNDSGTLVAEAPPWRKPMGPELSRMSDHIRNTTVRHWSVQGKINSGAVFEFLKKWGTDGRFDDLTPEQAGESMVRLWALALNASNQGHMDESFRRRYYTELARVLAIEAETPTPWPTGAFSVPRAFFGIWFLMEPQMATDWSNSEYRNSIEEIYRQGTTVARHAWTYPYAMELTHDPIKGPTDTHLRSIPHFMVANFIPYRSVFAYALFTGDDRYLEVISNTIRRSLQEPVNFAEPEKGFWPEGINVDRTVSAHGRQSYLFGYGVDYMRGILQEAAPLLKGGPYALSTEDYNVLSDVLLDGMQWFIHRGQADYSLLGRHNLYPQSGINSDKGLIKLAQQLLEVGGEDLRRKQELQAMVARLQANGDLVGSRYFWNMEDYVHRGQGFTVVVNMNSTRTAGPENVKPWAEQNFHFGNGPTLIYLDGDEYTKARGAWNFRALPGITAEYLVDPPPYIRTWEGIRGTKPFAGGVSDGKSGAAAFVSALNGKAARAEKAYFFHENIVVCLGTQIRRRAATGSVRTTLNSTEWRSAVSLRTDQREQQFPLFEEFAFGPVAAPAIFWHDRVAYLVKDGAASMLGGLRKTDWPALAKQNTSSSEPQDVQLFDLFIEHEDGASYAYAIYLNVDQSDTKSVLQQPGWQLLENNSALQAVAFEKDASLLGIVFRKPGTLAVSTFTLSSDSPAIVLLQRHQDGAWSGMAQDPLHRNPSENLNLTMIDSASNKTTRATITFPVGDQLGKPVSFSLR